MVGEVGLDGGARLRWPIGARHLYVEKYPSGNLNGGRESDGQVGEGVGGGEGEGGGEEEEEWKRLTPFKTNIQHQKEIVEKQMELAIELGVNVSFHSVSAAGESLVFHPLCGTLSAG